MRPTKEDLEFLRHCSNWYCGPNLELRLYPKPGVSWITIVEQLINDPSIDTRILREFSTTLYSELDDDPEYRAMQWPDCIVWFPPDLLPVGASIRTCNCSACPPDLVIASIPAQHFERITGDQEIWPGNMTEPKVIAFHDGLVQLARVVARHGDVGRASVLDEVNSISDIPENMIALPRRMAEAARWPHRVHENDFYALLPLSLGLTNNS